MNDGVGQLTETTASTNRRRMWDRNRNMDLTPLQRQRMNTLKPISQKQNKLGHKRGLTDFCWLFK